MIISIVAAIAQNGVIGDRGKVPWEIPEDMRRFKRLTMGKPIIMGRRTHDSIGKVLHGRKNIVLSHRPLDLDGAVLADGFDAAIRAAGWVKEVMVVGGASVYWRAIPAAHTMHLSRVQRRPDGDTRFPAIPAREWVLDTLVKKPGVWFEKWDRVVEIMDEREKFSPAGNPYMRQVVRKWDGTVTTRHMPGEDGRSKSLEGWQ